MSARNRARSAPTPTSLNIPPSNTYAERSSNGPKETQPTATATTLKSIPVSPLGRSRKKRRKSDPPSTRRPRSRTQHDLKEAGKRYQMYDKVQARDFLKNVDMHFRKKQTDRPKTPPKTPPTRVRSMPLSSTPPRRRKLSQNIIPFTSPLRIQRSRSTPSKIHHVRSYVHNVRYEKLVRCMNEVSKDATSLLRICSSLSEVEKRILNMPEAITNQAADYETMRQKRKDRDAKRLDELLRCCGTWSELSDDDEEEEEEKGEEEEEKEEFNTDEKRKSFYSSSSGNLGSWISTRLWGAAATNNNNESMITRRPYYNRLKRLSCDSQRYLATIQNAIKIRSSELSLSERRREQAMSKWTFRRDLISKWSLSEDAIRRFENRWILTEQRLSLQVCYHTHTHALSLSIFVCTHQHISP